LEGEGTPGRNRPLTGVTYQWGHHLSVNNTKGKMDLKKKTRKPSRTL